MALPQKASKKNKPHHRIKSAQRLSLAAMLLIAATQVWADVQKLQSIPLPEGVVIQSVALDVVQHGHRLSMATLQNTGSIESVLEHLRSSWDNGDTDLPGYVEERAGGWHIISQIEDGWNKVVQLRNNARNIEAYASVMQLEPVKGSSYRPVMPRNGVLVSSMAGKEFGKATQTDVVFSKSRQGEVASFYRTHFSGRGWVIISDRDIDGVNTFLAQSDGKQAEIVVSSVQNGAVAVINQVGD